MTVVVYNNQSSFFFKVCQFKFEKTVIIVRPGQNLKNEKDNLPMLEIQCQFFPVIILCHSFPEQHKSILLDLWIGRILANMK